MAITALLTNNLIAGIDEAGRGPLAGPVYAAAVILDPDRPIIGLKDSKKLSAARREMLNFIIRERALSYAISRAEVAEIDNLNILQATFLAMRRAIMNLSINPQLILVDGNQCPKLIAYPCHAIIKGDASEPAISAASILAKVARDAEMVKLDALWPEYGFAKHKGYPTTEHMLVLAKLGPCPEHRRSFKPVQNCCAKIL